jgi:hypothetical protein
MVFKQMPAGGIAGLAERTVALKGKRKSTMKMEEDVVPQAKKPKETVHQILTKKDGKPSITQAVYRLSSLKI